MTKVKFICPYVFICLYKLLRFCRMLYYTIYTITLEEQNCSLALSTFFIAS